MTDGNNGTPVAAVIDTSFLMGALLSPVCADEQENDAADYIGTVIAANGQLFVPQLFWFESGNVLCSAARMRKDGRNPRITMNQLLIIEENLAELPLVTDGQPDLETRMRIREIALAEGLSFYDASYLELALRYNLPLKTHDALLLAAAARQ